MHAYVQTKRLGQGLHRNGGKEGLSYRLSKREFPGIKGQQERKEQSFEGAGRPLYFALRIRHMHSISSKIHIAFNSGNSGKTSSLEVSGRALKSVFSWLLLCALAGFCERKHCLILLLMYPQDNPPSPALCSSGPAELSW